MTDYTVEVSDSALMHLCIAGLESYRVPDKPKEVFACCGETRPRKKRTKSIIGSTMFFSDIEAKRKKNSVVYNDEGIHLKQEIIEGCWPTQTFLGDFHTHLCNGPIEVKSQPDCCINSFVLVRETSLYKGYSTH